MATWVEPIDTETDPDAPLTAQLGKRWDNNVIAMAEGALGSPKVTGLALDIFRGEWTATTTTTMATITVLKDHGLLLCSGMTTRTGGTGSLDITYQTSTNGGGTWSSSTRFFIQDVLVNEKSLVRVLDISGDINAIRFLSIFGGDADGTCFIGVSTIGRSVA